MADSASPRDGFTGLRPDTARTTPATRAQAPLTLQVASCVRRGVEAPLQGRAACRWTVLRDVQATNCQRRGRHAFVQPVAASRGV